MQSPVPLLSEMKKNASYIKYDKYGYSYYSSVSKDIHIYYNEPLIHYHMSGEYTGNIENGNIFLWIPKMHKLNNKNIINWNKGKELTLWDNKYLTGNNITIEIVESSIGTQMIYKRTTGWIIAKILSIEIQKNEEKEEEKEL